MTHRGKDDPLLSVVIPVYNVEKYLDRCMESVLGQTYRNLEIILVDDGSADSSGDMCDAYAAKDKRVRVIHKENAGTTSARKSGALAATGVYITLVDSDDWIEKNMYEDMLDVMTGSDADIVISGKFRDYGNHSAEEKEGIAAGVYEGKELEEKVLMQMISTDRFYENKVSAVLWNKVYRRTLYIKYQMQVDDSIQMFDDAACVYPCILNANRIAVTGASYYHYCIRGGTVASVLHRDSWERYQVLFHGIKEEFEKHILRVPNIMRQFEVFQSYAILLQCTDRIVCYKNGTLFPFGQVKKEERLVIYGAGRFGSALKQTLEEKFQCNVVAWVDKSGKDGTVDLEYLNKNEYDKVMIGVLKANLIEQIEEELLCRGVQKEKILKVDVNML